MYLRASTLFLINPGIDEQRHIFMQHSPGKRAVLNSIQPIVTKSVVWIRTSPDNGFCILLDIFFSSMFPLSSGTEIFRKLFLTGLSALNFINRIKKTTTITTDTETGIPGTEVSLKTTLIKANCI